VRESADSPDYTTAKSGAAAISMAVLKTICCVAHPSMLVFLGLVKLIEGASIAHTCMYRGGRTLDTVVLTAGLQTVVQTLVLRSRVIREIIKNISL
jgi:hypothetical protein